MRCSEWILLGGRIAKKSDDERDNELAVNNKLSSRENRMVKLCRFSRNRIRHKRREMDRDELIEMTLYVLREVWNCVTMLARIVNSREWGWGRELWQDVVRSVGREHIDFMLEGAEESCSVRELNVVTKTGAVAECGQSGGKGLSQVCGRGCEEMRPCSAKHVRSCRRCGSST